MDYTPNGLNQYANVDGTAYAYDANGNLTSDGTNTYLYDVENRLVKVTGANTATMHYDTLGRLWRVKAANGDERHMLYDGDALVAEYNGSGQLLTRYVHGTSGADDPLVSYDGSSVSLSNARFLFADRRGSIVLKAPISSGTTTAYTYDEFGVPGGATPDRFGYTGQAWVPEAGLYYYKARMYSPTLGRFMQTDPIGYGDGMNMYAYVGNDPVNFVDPWGMNGHIIVDGKRPDKDDECEGTCYDGDSFRDLIQPEPNVGPEIVVPGEREKKKGKAKPKPRKFNPTYPNMIGRDQTNNRKNKIKRMQELRKQLQRCTVDCKAKAEEYYRLLDELGPLDRVDEKGVLLDLCWIAASAGGAIPPLRPLLGPVVSGCATGKELGQ